MYELTDKQKTLSEKLMRYMRSGVRHAVSYSALPLGGTSPDVAGAVCMGFMGSLEEPMWQDIVVYPALWHGGEHYSRPMFNSAVLNGLRSDPTSKKAIDALVNSKRDWPVHFKKFLEWLWNDEFFGQVFQVKDIRQAFEEGQVLNLDCPRYKAQPALVLQRQCYEFPNKVMAWSYMVKAGVNPRLAAFLATMVDAKEGRKTLKWEQSGHFAFIPDYMDLEDFKAMDSLDFQEPSADMSRPYSCGYNRASHFYARKYDCRVDSRYDFYREFQDAVEYPELETRKCRYYGKQELRYFGTYSQMGKEVKRLVDHYGMQS